VVQIEAIPDALTCAVDSSHHAACWGNDRYERLGKGATTETCTNKRDTHPCAKTPLALPFKDVVEIRSSSHNLCVRAASGEVQCLGVGNGCSRGSSTYLSDRDFGVPSVVPDLNATSLLSERCALDADHRLVCWGNWSLGGLGELPKDMCGPTRILQAETKGAVSIAMAPYFGCAVAADGKAQCWGTNDDGVLGDGTRTKHMTGAPVAGLFHSVPADGPTPLDTLARKLTGTAAAGFGEVWANAELLTPAGVSLGRLTTAPDDQRGDVLHERYLVRIGAPKAGTVDIETLARDHDAPSCGGSLLDEHYALRGKVQVVDLAPVVARDSRIQNGDGTSITLGRGTDVEANERGTSVFVEGEWRTLTVPTKDLGLSDAAPGLQKQTKLSSAAVELDPDVELAVGALSFRAGQRYGDVHKDGGHWTVALANDCVEIRARADKDPTRQRGDGGSGMVGMRGGGRTYTIAAGARAYWANGEAAGACVSEWWTNDEPTRSGARMCFALHAGVTVCHDASDVKKR
jgi:hypothetical protein